MGLCRQEYWSGLPFPFPGDLPDPGTEPRSPALQADSLPSEPPGKHVRIIASYSEGLTVEIQQLGVLEVVFIDCLLPTLSMGLAFLFLFMSPSFLLNILHFKQWVLATLILTLVCSSVISVVVCLVTCLRSICEGCLSHIAQRLVSLVQLVLLFLFLLLLLSLAFPRGHPRGSIVLCSAKDSSDIEGELGKLLLSADGSMRGLGSTFKFQAAVLSSLACTSSRTPRHLCGHRCQ